MVEKRSKERKKRKRKAKAGQVITQKVTVNIGKTAPRRLSKGDYVKQDDIL